MLPLQDEGAELSAKHNSKAAKVSGIGKDPSTHTAFLPDKEREQQEQHLREQLKQEYELRQQVCIVQHTSIYVIASSGKTIYFNIANNSNNTPMYRISVIISFEFSAHNSHVQRCAPQTHRHVIQEFYALSLSV